MGSRAFQRAIKSRTVPKTPLGKTMTATMIIKPREAVQRSAIRWILSESGYRAAIALKGLN
jgi:hypothetical protein